MKNCGPLWTGSPNMPQIVAHTTLHQIMTPAATSMSPDTSTIIVEPWPPATSSSLNSPLPDQVQELLNFVASTHEAIHSEVDRHLSQGLVRYDQLEMLFCPNHIVVSKKSGSISAFALRSWPSGRSVLELDCWHGALMGSGSTEKRSRSQLFVR